MGVPLTLMGVPLISVLLMACLSGVHSMSVPLTGVVLMGVPLVGLFGGGRGVGV